MELLLGCGNSRKKQLWFKDKPEWKNLVTLDLEPDLNPDYCFDLDTIRIGNTLPFASQSFAEIHAYHVLEHIGRQGDYKGFFKEFTEFHRILKPNGLFFIIVPSFNSEWAWGDPGHTRVFTAGTWAFLDQEMYAKDVGKSPMTDYRYLWKGHFKLIHHHQENNNDCVILKKEEFNASREIQD